MSEWCFWIEPHIETWGTVMQSNQLNELAAALAKAQGAMTNATMNRVNPHFKSKYADLASVLDAIRKPLSENGLAVTQTVEMRDGCMVLRTTLLHAGGQWVASEYPLPLAARPQEMGSALTYARRYSLTSLICTSADEDDDAERAEKHVAGAKSNGALISQEQVAALDKLLLEVKADAGKFVKYMAGATRSNIQRIEDIPAKHFTDAVTALEAKRRKAP
jgi:hypothetical protein